MNYFDYEKVAQEAKISADELTELRQLMQQEFPTDEMMRELHLLRACMAIRDGQVSREEVLGQAPSSCAA